jgi:hypothetical protein
MTSRLRHRARKRTSSDLSRQMGGGASPEVCLWIEVSINRPQILRVNLWSYCPPWTRSCAATGLGIRTIWGVINNWKTIIKTWFYY